jgi:hypothetical protein
VKFPLAHVVGVLPQLREEKIELENVLEAESEAQVNRLNREISVLKLAAAQNGTNGTNGTNGNGSGNNSASTSALADDLAEFRARRRGSVAGIGAGPSTDTVLEALRRENEQLRGTLADMERDHLKLMRLNEIYREELIDHRRRVRFRFSSCGPVLNASGYRQGCLWTT